MLPDDELDVAALGADWWWSNLHKWGNAPATATAVWARSDLLRDTPHPIISWRAGQGLQAESAFTGTRDYSAVLTAPAAMAYRSQWRSGEGLAHAEHNRAGLCAAARMLEAAWGTMPPTPDSMAAATCMVELPPRLQINDIPGVPGAGARQQLRDRFSIEAAVANFGDKGNFVRLSHALYNTPADFTRLRDAINILADECADAAS